MKKIVIQGLGYVGLAMLAFCAGAKRKDKYLYKVIGVEKNSPKGSKIVQKMVSGRVAKFLKNARCPRAWR